MAGTEKQKTLFEDYDGFVDKFKPKKTTDDCYTPENIYEVVTEYVAETYGIRREDMVRPFWPGGDYERFDYPAGCCVVDNPPFSIITPICRELQRRKIRFFLFCPYLTSGTILKNTQGLSLVVAPCNVHYENGAEVATSFVTNMEPETAIRSDPELLDRLKAADAKNRKDIVKELPKYEYPDAVLTVSKVGWFAVHHTPYKLMHRDCCIISDLDEQRRNGKSIFGNGFLLTERAAAERAAAERAAAERAAAERAAAERAAAQKWKLSEREKLMQKMIEQRGQ